MTSLATSLMEQKILEDKVLMEKWSYLLEGVEGDENQRNTARLLENEEKFILLAEDTDSGNIAQFKKYAYPLIRRVYPTLSINDLVSVQPLEGPVGQIFTFQPEYGSTKGAITAGQAVYNNSSDKYASAIIDEETETRSSSSTAVSTTLAWKAIVPSSLSITIGSIVGTDDGEGVITGSGIATGSVVYSTGVVSITLDDASADDAVSTYSYVNEGNTQQPEINFEITSQAVQVGDRILRAKWTPQAIQDMMAVHGVSGDETFTAEMSRAVSREISLDVINQLYAAASAGSSWDKTRPTYISYDDHKRTFIDKLVEESNYIYTQCLRGAGNVIVVGSDAANIIKTLPTFRPEATATTNPNGKIGVLNDTWIVIQNIYFPTAQVLVGYKGEGFLESGAVFSPYSIMLTDSLLNPDDMKIRKGLLSRDAFTKVNTKFYRTFTVSAT